MFWQKGAKFLELRDQILSHFFAHFESVNSVDIVMDVVAQGKEVLIADRIQEIENAKNGLLQAR